MQYLKKVLVLKGIDNDLESKNKLNGLIRIEIENGVSEMHLSLINLPNFITSDYYALVVDCKKKEFEFNLGKRPSSLANLFPSEPNLEGGFCVGIYVIKDSLPLILSFASDTSSLSLQDFKKIVAEKCFVKHKRCVEKQKEGEIESLSFCPNPQNLTNEHFEIYNDEAVATENYFEIDEEINEKLLSLKERENESLQLENEFFDCSCQEKTQKDLPKTLCNENEKDSGKRKENCARHFDTVKAELDDIFFKFPEEQSLCQHFKDSRWARIYYSTEKYYVVGVIYESHKEKYICYGVPAKYSKTPPKELDGFCSFIPLSIFDMFGTGYWIMFQDAESGKCVHFN